MVELNGKIDQKSSTGCLKNLGVSVAPHNWSTKLVTYEGSNSLLLGLTTGDIIIFEYSVGGGGGHKLYIKSFTANFCEAKKQEMAKIIKMLNGSAFLNASQ